MSVTGSLTITLRVKDSVVYETALSGAKVVPIGELLRGKSGKEALCIISILFGLCPAAQTLAASLAIHSAQGNAPDTNHLTDLETANALETLRENLLFFVTRFVTDPEPNLKTKAIAVLRQIAQGKCPDIATRAALQNELFDGFNANAKDPDSLFTSETAIARAFDALKNISTADSIKPVENEPDIDIEIVFADPRLLFITSGAGGALSRLLPKDALISRIYKGIGNTVFTRTLARYVETRALLTNPLLINAQNTTFAKDRVAIARVHCARGALYHRVKLDSSGMISDYAIISPTEMHFGERLEALQTAFIGWKVKSVEELTRKACAYIDSFDPCLAYEVRIVTDA